MTNPGPAHSFNVSTGDEFPLCGRQSERGDQRGAVMVRISAVVTLTTPGRIGWDKDVLKLPKLSPGRAPVWPGLFICGARSILPVPFDSMAISAGKVAGEA